MPTSDPELIRASFNLVAPQAEHIIDRFYDNLFETAPGVRSMFPDDMTQQKKHLLGSVGLIVKHADNLAAISGALGDMGKRHARYGAQEAHYPVVRDVMLQTLSEVAGDAWTEEIHGAWERALNAVAGMMLKGAQRLAA